MTIPNILSILRILSLPVLFYLIKNDYPVAAFYLLIGSWFTDFLDGLIARTFNQRSKLGSYLDPIADKMVTTSLFIFLTIFNRLPLWLTAVVVVRDVAIFTGLLVLFLPRKFPTVSPSYLGKFTTFFQAATLLIVMSEGVPLFQGILPPFLLDVIYITALFTLLSFIQYTVRGIAMLKERNE